MLGNLCPHPYAATSDLLALKSTEGSNGSARCVCKAGNQHTLRGTWQRSTACISNDAVLALAAVHWQIWAAPSRHSSCLQLCGVGLGYSVVSAGHLLPVMSCHSQPVTHYYTCPDSTTLTTLRHMPRACSPCSWTSSCWRRAHAMARHSNDTRRLSSECRSTCSNVALDIWTVCLQSRAWHCWS